MWLMRRRVWGGPKFWALPTHLPGLPSIGGGRVDSRSYTLGAKDWAKHFLPLESIALC